MDAGLLWTIVAWRLRRLLPPGRVDPILVDLFDEYVPRRAASRARAAAWLLREAHSLATAYRAERRRRRTPRRTPAIETLWREARASARSLARTPGTTAAILLTLAIGIGANTAMFAVVDGVLLRPLPYPDEGRLVTVEHRSPGSATDFPSAPYLYFTYRDTARTIDQIGLWRDAVSTVTGRDRPEQVQALFVTHEVLAALAVVPVEGRVFTARDDAPGSDSTVVLTWPYWHRRFGADAAVLGTTLTIDGAPATVIGVLPETFSFLDRSVDLIAPFQLDPAQVTLGRYVFSSLARLRPGVTIADATADLATAVPLAIQRFPPPAGYTRERFAARPVVPHLTPLHDDVVGDVGRTLWVIMGALGAVLIIACANVGHLLMVRADARRRELAIRVALGAGPARIASGLLVEGLLLSLAAGAAGVLAASVSLQALLAIGPALPRARDIAIDARVVLFAVTASAAAGVALGLLPAAGVMRRLSPAIADGGRTASEGPERQRARSALVVVQVALALVLLVCSGLMIRTFRTLTRVDPGFTRPEEVQLVYVAGRLPDADRTARTQHDIADAIAALPGVTAVGFDDRPPLGRDNRGSDTVLTVEAATSPRVAGQQRPLRRFEFISPGYFAALGAPIVAGRDLDWTDLHDRHDVAIVAAELARQEWGSAAAALGKRVQVTPADTWREIVGVAGDVRDDGLQEPPPPIVYFPSRVDRFWGAPAMAFGNGTWLVRSSRAGTESLLRDIEAAVAKVDPMLPVSQARRLSDVHRRSLARTSFTLTLLIVAGGMGMCLGVIGIYGVVAYSVSRRTREIGLRLALGAPPRAVTRLFLRRGVLPGVIGLAAGLVAAMAVTRLMTTILAGVSPLDPLTFAAVVSVVLAVVTTSAYVPARRAAKRGPLDALR
jgi:predicted permease